MTSLIFFKIILSFFISSGFAQEKAPTALSEDKFAAIVQHTQGEPALLKNGKHTPLDFKDLIHFGDTVTVPKGARLKVITQKRCVAVFYDKSEIKAPKEKDAAWTLEKGSTRWICPEEKIELVNHSGTQIRLKNGEFLLTNEQLIPLRAHVAAEETPLKMNTVYDFKNDKLVEDPHQPEALELWKQDRNFPLPAESSQLSISKPEKPYNPMVTRIFIEGIPFGYAGAYQSYWERKASSFNMGTNGVRIGTNFPLKNKSLLVFLDFMSSQNPGHNHQNFMGPQPTGFKSFEADETTLGIGLRHDHVSSGSTYYYLGLSNIKYNFNIVPDTNENYNGNFKYDLAIAVGFGYQKIFWSRSWISLVVGAEAKITQSLTKGRLSDFQEFSPNKVDPSGYLTTYNVIVYFGPEFNF